MKPLIFNIYAPDQIMMDKIQNELEAEKGEVNAHLFPDGELLFRFESSLKNREVILVATLDHPNPKLLDLIFFARTAKDLGAKKLTLVAPYLAYMRQDKQFQIGEGVTSRYFASVLSSCFDALITVDPHLHRYKFLAEIYTIPTQVVSASAVIAEWISKNIKNAFLIGPDAESVQWVSDIAERCHSPFIILEKTRYSDHDVKMTAPKILATDEQTPVLLDDIVSSGWTLTEAAKTIQPHFKNKILCVAVHAVFSDAVYRDMCAHYKAAVGFELNLVTTNTVQHVTNKIDVSQFITDVLIN